MSEADGEYKRTVYHRGVFSPPLNIYTNDQPILNGSRSFINADGLCITAQYPTFQKVEQIIEEALGELSTLQQKQQSACESRQDASHGVSSAEQRGQEVAISIME